MCRPQAPRSLTSLGPSPPLAALAAALIGLSSEAGIRSSRDRDGPVVQYAREIAVAKDYPTVENMSWPDERGLRM